MMKNVRTKYSDQILDSPKIKNVQCFENVQMYKNSTILKIDFTKNLTISNFVDFHNEFLNKTTLKDILSLVAFKIWFKVIKLFI